MEHFALSTWHIFCVCQVAKAERYRPPERVLGRPQGQNERRQGRNRATGATRGRAGSPGAGDLRSRGEQEVPQPGKRSLVPAEGSRPLRRRRRRLREQHDAADEAGELEARKKELAKRLATKQAEKERYVRAYAQGHISEEELGAYLDELKKQIDKLRILLTSIEAELSERQERESLTDTAQTWLLSLGRRLDEVEEDTPKGFKKRKQLVGLLVEAISLGRSQQEGRPEVQITYRFGPPPDSDGESDALSTPGLKNGSWS